MTAAQYDELRVIPARFVVIPGHEATKGLAGDIAREPYAP
jgi:hypothetical protein